MLSLPEALPYSLPATARLLHTSHYLQLAIDAQQPWLYACWQGSLSIANLHEGVELVLKAVQEKGVAKLLNDNRYLTALSVEPAAWHDVDALQRLHAVGLHYVAWVYAPNVHGRHLADEAAERNLWPLTLTFEEYDMATEWLRAMPDPNRNAAPTPPADA